MRSFSERPTFLRIHFSQRLRYFRVHWVFYRLRDCLWNNNFDQEGENNTPLQRTFFPQDRSEYPHIQEVLYDIKSVKRWYKRGFLQKIIDTFKKLVIKSHLTMYTTANECYQRQVFDLMLLQAESFYCMQYWEKSSLWHFLCEKNVKIFRILVNGCDIFKYTFHFFSIQEYEKKCKKACICILKIHIFGTNKSQRYYYFRVRTPCLVLVCILFSHKVHICSFLISRNTVSSDKSILRGWCICLLW